MFVFSSVTVTIMPVFQFTLFTYSLLDLFHWLNSLDVRKDFLILVITFEIATSEVP